MVVATAGTSLHDARAIIRASVKNLEFLGLYRRGSAARSQAVSKAF